MQKVGELISRSRHHLHRSIRPVASLSRAGDSNFPGGTTTTPRTLPGGPACQPPSLFRASFRRHLILQTAPEPVKLNRLSESDTGIVEVKFDRPEAKNAIGKEMLKGIQRVIEAVNGDSSTNVVMLSSSVPRVFCAGADLKERRLMGPSEVQSFVNSLRSTFSSFEAIEVPTIAIVEGAALGGGLELVLSCDIRVCGESATFSLPETGLAIIPGAGGTQRLPRMVGRSIAKELIFTGRRIDANEALSIGLVNYCVPTGEAYQKALQLAREINQKGPLALKMAKKAISEGMEVDLSSALVIEEQCYEELLNTEDRLEGLAAFAEKRKPKYTVKVFSLLHPSVLPFSKKIHYNFSTLQKLLPPSLLRKNCSPPLFRSLPSPPPSSPYLLSFRCSTSSAHLPPLHLAHTSPSPPSADLILPFSSPAGLLAIVHTVSFPFSSSAGLLPSCCPDPLLPLILRCSSPSHIDNSKGSWYMAMDAGSANHTSSCTVHSYDFSTQLTLMAFHEG